MHSFLPILSTRSATNGRTRLVAAILMAAILVGGFALAMAAPLTASAATLPGAVTSVTVLAPDPGAPNRPLVVGQTFQVDATWAVPDGSAPGDTFALAFPSPVGGYLSAFDLTDTAGIAVGHCVVTANSFLCTLGDYVASHTGVAGSLHFTAVAKAVASGTFGFVSDNGVSFVTPIPGGSVGQPQQSVITDPAKGSAILANGNIQWEVVIPADRLVDGLVLTDVFSAGQTLDASSFRVVSGLRSDFVGWSFRGAGTAVPAGVEAGHYELVSSPSSSRFTVTFHGPTTSADTLYVLLYQTTPAAGTEQGAHFSNSITGNGDITASSAIDFVTAGGTGSGTNVPPVVVPPVVVPPVVVPPTPPVVVSPVVVPPVTPSIVSPVAVPPVSLSAAPSPVVANKLAYTGADASGVIGVGSLMLLAGATLALLGRRQRRISGLSRK